jgi:predicted transcriptional regulator
MIPAKEEVRRLLELLPDDASLEDIQYHIYVRQKIVRGLEDIETGRTLSEEEFEARMSKWLEP